MNPIMSKAIVPLADDGAAGRNGLRRQRGVRLRRWLPLPNKPIPAAAATQAPAAAQSASAAASAPTMAAQPASAPAQQQAIPGLTASPARGV